MSVKGSITYLLYLILLLKLLHLYIFQKNKPATLLNVLTLLQNLFDVSHYSFYISRGIYYSSVLINKQFFVSSINIF